MKSPMLMLDIMLQLHRNYTQLPLLSFTLSLRHLPH